VCEHVFFMRVERNFSKNKRKIFDYFGEKKIEKRNEQKTILQIKNLENSKKKEQKKKLFS